MHTTKKELSNILQMSNLYADDNSITKIEKNIESILSWVEKLNQINTENIEPMIHPLNASCKTFHKSAITSMNHQDVLQNAPNKNSTYIVVPKVI